MVASWTYRVLMDYIYWNLELKNQMQMDVWWNNHISRFGTIQRGKKTRWKQGSLKNNPNNALLKGSSSNLPYLLQVWPPNWVTSPVILPDFGCKKAEIDPTFGIVLLGFVEVLILGRLRRPCNSNWVHERHLVNPHIFCFFAKPIFLHPLIHDMKVYLLIEILGGGNSKIFYFHPEPWGNDPIGLYNIFQMAWNHQPG